MLVCLFILLCSRYLKPCTNGAHGSLIQTVIWLAPLDWWWPNQASVIVESWDPFLIILNKVHVTLWWWVRVCVQTNVLTSWGCSWLRDVGLCVWITQPSFTKNKAQKLLRAVLWLLSVLFQLLLMHYVGWIYICSRSYYRQVKLNGEKTCEKLGDIWDLYGSNGGGSQLSKYYYL